MYFRKFHGNATFYRNNAHIGSRKILQYNIIWLYTFLYSTLEGKKCKKKKNNKIKKKKLIWVITSKTSKSDKTGKITRKGKEKVNSHAKR